MLKRLVASLLLLPAVAAAQNVRVVVDPRAEVVGILFRIAGASDFSNGTIQPYIREVDSAFLPFTGHAMFRDIDALRARGGLSLSAVMSLAPQIADPLSFRERSPIDAPTSTLAPEWHGADARAMLAHACDFPRAARVARFLHEHQPLYDSASARMQRLVERPGFRSDDNVPNQRFTLRFRTRSTP